MSQPSPLPVRDGVNATRLRLPDSGWPTVLDYVLHRWGHVDPEGIVDRFRTGEVRAADGTVITETTPLGVHGSVWYYRSVPREDPIPFDLEVLHRDEHLVVADKPHFLPTTPGGRFVQESALVRLRNRLGLDHLVPIHRLDRATAGVVMFSTDPDTRGAYQVLFERRQVWKQYEAVSALGPLPVPAPGPREPRDPDGGRAPGAEGTDGVDPEGTGPEDVAALVHRFPLTYRNRMDKVKGVLTARTLDYPPLHSGRAPGTPARRGRRTNRPTVGANAETRIELIGTGVSAGTWAGAAVGHFRLFPRTGRTHQLRVHLAALGLGILNDPFYPELLDVAPDDYDRPLQLLAHTIGFTDPLTGRERRFGSGLRLRERPA
ncbi:pseudouridine synthase [Citricoccus sp. SGAir0253]|uniref:pseudouridine synthase n=1 Tax=Citricoccus sp. SGAir0253 TaxID=2567881 RepID=UPI0010CD5A51|nr:pseudouridine synthase [Citricoccus sp. SGAir0253]QCU78861.1 pseudouridine synthase [Citricoccus sp. SGAir0253]